MSKNITNETIKVTTNVGSITCNRCGGTGKMAAEKKRDYHFSLLPSEYLKLKAKCMVYGNMGNGIMQILRQLEKYESMLTMNKIKDLVSVRSADDFSILQ